MTEILSAHRIGFKHSVAGKNLPELIKITKNLGKYGVIVFEDYNSYLNMDQWNRDLLDKYWSSSSHVFTIPESTKNFHEIFFVVFFYKVEVFDIEVKNANITVYYERKIYFTAL